MLHNFLQSLLAIPRSSMTENFDAESLKASRSTRNSLSYNPAIADSIAAGSSIEMSVEWSEFHSAIPYTVYRETMRVFTVSPASRSTGSLFLQSSALRPNKKDWCEAVTARFPRYRRQVADSHLTVDVLLISGCLSTQRGFSGWKDTIPLGLLVCHSPREPILPWEVATKD
jgi:hypothetical protein